MLSEEGRRRQLAELTVLIADDDKIILENIVRNIDWEAQGFKVVGTALNGAQALALFRELHPDLVVTDVLMPVLSGLDLIREIRAESPHTPVLLISSYEEFAYVRQALFMGAQGYVLKSEIFGAEFRERLARIRDGISQERTSRKAFERGLIERWFARNAGAVIGEEAWSAERESSLPRGKFRFALFGEWMPVRFSEAAEPEADMEVRRERMMNLLPERLKSGVTFFARDVLVVGLTPERWDERALGEYAGVLSRALHREPWRLFAREAMTLEQLCGCLSARVNALRYLRCFREGAPRALEALAPDPQDKGPRFPYPDLINVHADASEIEAKLQDYLKQIEARRDHAALSIFARRFGMQMEILGDLRATIEDYRWFSSMEEMRAYVISTYKTCLKLAGQTRGRACTQPVRAALEYLDANFADPELRVENVAREAALSLSHLQVQFKKEVGKTISEYLTDKRVMEAIRLLETTQMKVYEIAGAVGYSSSQYFSQVLLQRTRKRPLDYRRANTQ